MAIYNGIDIADLDVTTPVESATTLRELNDAIRELKVCLKNTFGVEHTNATGLHNKLSGINIVTHGGTVVVRLSNGEIVFKKA